MSHCERKRAAASAAYKHFPGPGGLGKSCLRGNSLAPEAVEKRGPRRRRSLFRGKHACAEPDAARGTAVPGQFADILKGGAACPVARDKKGLRFPFYREARAIFVFYAASGQGSASAQGGVIGTKAAGSGVRRKSSATAQTLSTQLTTKDSR